MGMIMREDDVFIPSLLDELNVRFAPLQVPDVIDKLEEEKPLNERRYFGGVLEMSYLQKKFEIFRPKRTFDESVRTLHLSPYNHPTKNRWIELLHWLVQTSSNIRGATKGRALNGDRAIVNTIIKDLKKTNPMPIYFTSHHAASQKEAEVTINPHSKPISYMKFEYITISIPMIPKPSR